MNLINKQFIEELIQELERANEHIGLNNPLDGSELSEDMVDAQCQIEDLLETLNKIK